MKRALNLLFLLGTIFFLNSCGYHLGSIAHPQVKTMGIAPVVNETLEYNVSAYMRRNLCEQVMKDGSYKLKDLKQADCIIYAKICKVAYTAVTDASYDDEHVYRAAEWRVEIMVEFQAVIPGRKEPLVPKGLVRGTTIFQVWADMDTNKRRGVEMACYDAARQIIHQCTENW